VESSLDTFPMRSQSARIGWLMSDPVRARRPHRNRFTSRLLAGILLFATARQGLAHCLYKEVTPQAPVEDYWAGNRAWADGTRPVLADSHRLLGAGSYFYKFHLDGESLVTLTLETVPVQRDGQTYPAGLDPAFSLYRGLMPLYGHDDTPYDPANPLDDIDFLPVASPVDVAPEGHVYAPHDGYRDTHGYSTTGGLFSPANDGGNADLDGSPVNPFVGQFDALGDWSMGNEWAVPGQPTLPSGCPVAKCPDGNPAGDWAKIFYVGHKNDHAGIGATPDTTTEILEDQDLEPGDYTVVIGGGCADCLPNGFFGGRLSIAIKTVPQPPACAGDTGPQIAVLGNPLDGEVGKALSWVRISAFSCSADPVAIELLKGPRGAAVSDTTYDPATHKFAATLQWVPPPSLANKILRLSVRAVETSGLGRESAVVKTAIRIFPAGRSSARAVRSIKVSHAQWNAATGTLVASGKIRLLPIVTKQERGALLSGTLDVRLDDGNTGGAVLGTARLEASGRWKAEFPVVESAVPCGVSVRFQETQAARTVKRAPASCVMN